MTADRTAATDQQFADMLAQVEAGEEADVLADVTAAAEARGRAEIAAKVERLAAEFDGRAYHAPIVDKVAANPRTTDRLAAIEVAYADAAAHLRALVADAAPARTLAEKATLCYCDADIMPPHPRPCAVADAAPAGRDAPGRAGL